jgi:hypothetical protein
LGEQSAKVLSEREIRDREREEDRLVASVKLTADSRPVLHRPDLALIAPGGQVAAVEVELSVKARARLAVICRGWARARHLLRVYYLATPPALGAVTRAVNETRAGDRVTVLPLEQTTALAAAERAEASHVDH